MIPFVDLFQKYFMQENEFNYNIFEKAEFIFGKVEW